MSPMLTAERSEAACAEFEANPVTVPRRFLIQFAKDNSRPEEYVVEAIKDQLDRWGREGGALVVPPGFLIFGEHNGQWQCLNSVAEPPVEPTPQVAWWRRWFGGGR